MVFWQKTAAKEQGQDTVTTRTGTFCVTGHCNMSILAWSKTSANGCGQCYRPTDSNGAGYGSQIPWGFGQLQTRGQQHVIWHLMPLALKQKIL